MTTLIAAYNSDGCIGRCDAKCYDATTHNCTCICGGVNHGAGIDQAAKNTEAMAEEWIEAYQQQRPEAERFKVLPKPVQLSLF